MREADELGRCADEDSTERSVFAPHVNATSEFEATTGRSHLSTSIASEPHDLALQFSHSGVETGTQRRAPDMAIPRGLGEASFGAHKREQCRRRVKLLPEHRSGDDDRFDERG